MRHIYTTPETEITGIRLENGLLIVSGGAQSEGFTSKGAYTDDDWDIQ